MRIAQVSKVVVAITLLCFVFSLAAVAGEGSKEKLPPLSKKTRFDLIRALAAERVYARKYFPVGKKSLTMKPDGTIVPEGMELQMLLAKFGPAAKPGQKVRITNVEIKDRKLIFEINGGPVKKKKWYERIEVGASGGSTAPLDRGQSNEDAKGSALTVEFKDYVPEMTAEQVKELLKPILDFTSISPLQAYLDVVPAVVKEAIKNHEVLVGMDGEMVRHAKDRPPQKIREKDGDVAYEEWIYGAPPEDVLFVRLVQDRVVQVKLMKMNGERIIKTERIPEIDDYFAKQGMAVAEQQQQQAPTKAPTLKRPGETTEDPNQPGVIYPPVPPCSDNDPTQQNCRRPPPDTQQQTRPE